MNNWNDRLATIAVSAIVMAGLAACSNSTATDAKKTKAADVKSSGGMAGTIAPTDKAMTPDERYNHALKLFDEGKYEEAEKNFERVTDLWPKFSKPFKHLARTQLKLGKFEEALGNALDAADLNPKDGTIDNVIGLAYMELDDFDSADTAFQSAIAKSPKFVWAYNNLGHLRIQKGEFEKAREILVEGSLLDQAPAVLFNNLGVALEKTGDTAGAQAAYATAVEIDPAYKNAKWNLSRVGLPPTETEEVATESDTKEIEQVAAAQGPAISSQDTINTSGVGR